MENEYNIGEKNRNKQDEYLAKIDDNQIKPVKDEENKNFDDKLKIIESILKELGYKCEIKFDEQKNPIALVIYDEQNNILSYINEEKGLQNFAVDSIKIEEELRKNNKILTDEEMNKLIEGNKQLSEEDKLLLEGQVNNAELSDEDKLRLQGEIQKEKLDKDEKQQLTGKKSIETKETLEEELKENTGDEYEILGMISETGKGNAFILSKIHATQGFVGNIYKVRKKSTGECSIAGKESGENGKLKIANYKRKPMPSTKTAGHKVGGNSLTESQHENASDVIEIDGNISIEITENELNAVISHDGKTDSIKMETTPVKGQQTTEEIEEVKLNPEKMDKVEYLLKKLNITQEERDARLKKIMNNGANIDNDISQLNKEIEEQENKKEKEENELEDYDPRDPNYRSEMRLNREREIKN